MSIALKLAIEDVEAELAAAPPHKRPAIQKRLGELTRALAVAAERGNSNSWPVRVVRAAADPETGADVEVRMCLECGTEADPEDKFCSKCGEALDDDEDEPSPEAVRAAIDRSVLSYAGNVSGKSIKVSDLSTFDGSMRARTAATRIADLARVRAGIEASRKR